MAPDWSQGVWPSASQAIALGATQHASGMGVLRTSSQASQEGARGLEGGSQGGLQARQSQGTGVFAEDDSNAQLLGSAFFCLVLLDSDSVGLNVPMSNVHIA